jgi:uncharacterized protein involved in exopolysaccharide biosynthesis
MSQQNQQPEINAELVIEDLLEQNKQLTKEKAYSAAINQQLQQESRQFLDYAKSLEQKVEELEKKLVKNAGPVPVKEAAAGSEEPIEAEIVEEK